MVRRIIFFCLILLSFNTYAQTCTTTLSSGANVGSSISSAAGGAVICLNNGNYSGFTLNNVVKSPRVIVKAINSKNATFTSPLEFLGNSSGITFDGINFTGIQIFGAGVSNLTFKNADSSPGAVKIDYVATAIPNLVFENLTHYNQDADNFCNISSIYCVDTAAYFLPGPSDYRGGSTVPVAIIRGAFIDGGCADGINHGVPILIEYSVIQNRLEGACGSEAHVDATQMYGGDVSGTIYRYNYYYNNQQMMAAYDGLSNVLIEHNVLDVGTSGRAASIEAYSDDGSIIRNNTVIDRGLNLLDDPTGGIELNHKPADTAGINTQVYNNIMVYLALNNGSTASVNTKNLMPYNSGTNIEGVPTFKGTCGGSKTLGQDWSGCALATGSAGKNGGSDGKDVGSNYYGIRKPTGLN